MRTCVLFNKAEDKGTIKTVVIPATRITARVSVVSRELSVRTRAAIAQTTGSKLKNERRYLLTKSSCL